MYISFTEITINIPKTDQRFTKKKKKGGVRLWALCAHHDYVKLDVLKSSLQITTRVKTLTLGLV